MRVSHSLYLPLIQARPRMLAGAQSDGESGDGARPQAIVQMTVRAASAAAPVQRVALPTDPARIAANPELGRIYLSSDARQAVLALDAETLAVEAVSPAFAQIGGLALLQTDSGALIFAADTLAGSVRMLDADTLETVAETIVGPGPYAVAVAQSTGRIFVALTGSDEVALLAADGSLLGRTALGGLGFPQGLAADEAGGRVYVSYLLSPRYGQIAALDARTGAVVQTIPPTLDRPLAGIGAVTLVNGAASLPPAERQLQIETDQGPVIFALTRQEWTD